MVEVTAVKELRYDGKTYMPGETLHVTEKDADLLRRVGKVTAFDGIKRNLTDIKMVEPVEPNELTEDEEEAVPLFQPRRRYRRRDMEAE